MKRSPINKVSPKRLKLMEEGVVDRFTNMRKWHPHPTAPNTLVNDKGDIKTWSRKVSSFIESGLLGNAKSMVAKPPIKRKPIRKRSPNNKGGQMALFKRIWHERPHRCEVCGVPIGEPTASNFSHLLPKGVYRNLKLDERNVEIWCEECHEVWHTVAHIHLTSKNWTRVHMKAQELRVNP